MLAFESQQKRDLRRGSEHAWRSYQWSNVGPRVDAAEHDRFLGRRLDLPGLTESHELVRERLAALFELGRSMPGCAYNDIVGRIEL